MSKNELLKQIRQELIKQSETIEYICCMDDSEYIAYKGHEKIVFTSEEAALFLEKHPEVIPCIVVKDNRICDKDSGQRIGIKPNIDIPQGYKSRNNIKLLLVRPEKPLESRFVLIDRNFILKYGIDFNSPEFQELIDSELKNRQ